MCHAFTLKAMLRVCFHPEIRRPVMNASLDLLDRALKQNGTQADWCRELHVNRNALGIARARGRLSPTIAGNLARLLGEDPTYWTALAALEAEPDSYGRRKLLNELDNGRKS
jgi:plasmid maintenance system antidote protein VapI